MSGLLHQGLARESTDDILPPDFLNFCRRVLLNEVFYEHVAAADAYVNLIALLNLDVHAFRSKLVNALGLTKEHDLHAVTLRISIDEPTQVLVDAIVLPRYVDDLMPLELTIQVDELDDLGLCHPQLELQHL